MVIFQIINFPITFLFDENNHSIAEWLFSIFTRNPIKSKLLGHCISSLHQYLSDKKCIHNWSYKHTNSSGAHKAQHEVKKEKKKFSVTNSNTNCGQRHILHDVVSACLK